MTPTSERKPLGFLYDELGDDMDEGAMSDPDPRLDNRPVDLNWLIEKLEWEIDNTGEVGIWGDYGAPAAPVEYIARLLVENADAIEGQTGQYADEDAE